MNKLEEDYSYLHLQQRLKEQRAVREKVEAEIRHTVNHINAIKRDFRKYEENS